MNEVKKNCSKCQSDSFCECLNCEQELTENRDTMSEPFKVKVVSFNQEKARLNGRVYNDCMQMILKAYNDNFKEMTIEVTTCEIEDVKQELAKEKSKRVSMIEEIKKHCVKNYSNIPFSNKGYDVIMQPFITLESLFAKLEGLKL